MTKVNVEIHTIHTNGGYWNEPVKFDPDRFKPGNKAYAYLPFGAAPGNCIGLRFALIESKLALARMIQVFKNDTSFQ